jgi:hypothetical protein
VAALASVVSAPAAVARTTSVTRCAAPCGFTRRSPVTSVVRRAGAAGRRARRTS